MLAKRERQGPIFRLLDAMLATVITIAASAGVYALAIGVIST